MAPNEEMKTLMRSAFEAGLPGRMERAAKVNLQQFIPSHWFAAAASESASMYIAGFHYGCISIAQAYVEALSRFLVSHHKLKPCKDFATRWARLRDAHHVSALDYDSAMSIYSDRNDFHHLNSALPSDHKDLEDRAEACLNAIHTIESNIFSYSINPEQPGQVLFKNPNYWPSAGNEHARVFLRNPWL